MPFSLLIIFNLLFSNATAPQAADKLIGTWRVKTVEIDKNLDDVLFPSKYDIMPDPFLESLKEMEMTNTTFNFKKSGIFEIDEGKIMGSWKALGNQQILIKNGILADKVKWEIIEKSQKGISLMHYIRGYVVTLKLERKK